MRWCRNEGSVPALYDAAHIWVSDSVGFALLAIVAHLPFPCRRDELSEVLNVHEGSSSDEAKVREVGFLVLLHFGFGGLGCRLDLSCLE